MHTILQLVNLILSKIITLRKYHIECDTFLRKYHIKRILNSKINIRNKFEIKTIESV